MNNATHTQKYTAKTYYDTVKNTSQLTELLDGEIVAMASPSILHQRISGGLYRRLGSYIDANHGGCDAFIAPTDVKLDEENIVVPDVFIACHADWFDSQKYNGAPDFVAEVVSSNRSDDFDRKLWLYRTSGVREYWIIDPQHQKTVTYFFEESQIPHIYTFDTPIPMRIYQNHPDPLTICIQDLL